MNIRRFPTAVEYSAAYQSALRRASVEIDLHRRLGDWPLPRLVWQARNAYAAAWAADQERKPA